MCDDSTAREVMAMFTIDDMDPNGLIRNGDEMTQPEFFRLYSRTKGFRAELLDGTVFVREPLSNTHGINHVKLTTIFAFYESETEGVQTSDNASVILSPKDEVQPDLLLRILPHYKGQTRDVRRKKEWYIGGAPELVAEIAASSRSDDLHKKRVRYERAGVRELVVLCLYPRKLFWFDLCRHSELLPDTKGVLRSTVFPGLWISEPGVLSQNYKECMRVARRGVESREHAEFVRQLSGRLE